MRLEQVDRRRLLVQRAQALERRADLAGGARARRVAPGDQVERGRLHRHQRVPQAQRLGVVAAGRGALAGDEQRPGVARRDLARLGDGGVGGFGLMRGVGLERELAPVVRDARGERAGAARLELAGDLDRRLPLAGALVQVEQGEPRLGVEGAAGERLVGVLGAVEQAGLHVVLGQRVLGADALVLGQVGAAEQVLVHPHRALVLAAAAEQVAEGEVQVGGVGVLLHRLDEGVDRLVVLLVEQQVQALVVGLGLLLLAPQLAHVEPRGDPAEGERQRQRPQQPLQLKVHRAADAARPTPPPARPGRRRPACRRPGACWLRERRRWRHQLGTIAKMPKAQPRPKAASTMSTIGALPDLAEEPVDAGFARGCSARRRTGRRRRRRGTARRACAWRPAGPRG